MEKHDYDSSRQRQTCAEVMQHHYRWRDLTVISMAVLTLSACSLSTLAPATPSIQGRHPPASMDPAYGQVLRVIVKFRQAVPYRDAAFLQDIARQIGARIAYISSVSIDTHVYQIELQPGQSHADILGRLSGIPDVLWVQADAVARPS